MIDVSDVLRIVLTFTMPETTVAQLVWHYLVTAGTPETETSVLSFIVNNTVNAFAGILVDMSNQVAGDEFEMLKWDFTLNRWDGVANENTTSIDGVDTIDMLPHGVGPLTVFHTGVGRRRGRKFIPGYVEDTQDQGILDVGAAARLITHALIFDNDIASATLTSKPGNFNVDPLSPLFETFAEWNKTAGINTTIAYQRRRKAGVGI